MNPLLHFMGVDDVSGRWYGFWSGIGSDIGEVAIVGALIGMIRKHNCHETGCWRIGRFPVEGTPWTVCHKHHPAPPGKGDIHRRYHLFLGERPGRG